MSPALFQNDALCRMLLDNLSEGVYFTDTKRRIQYWNGGAEQITGYNAVEVLGHCCADNILMHTDTEGISLCQELCPLAATMADFENRTARVYLHHKEGHRLPVIVTTAAIRDEKGELVGGLETFHDATMEMSALAQVEELTTQALLCPLTGVGNRRYAEQVLETKFHEMNRSASSLGIIFIDIDHFKLINDTYGHGIGDVVLKMVARTLANAMRTYDFLARWGGEEFIAVLPNLDHRSLGSFSERLRALVEKSSATFNDEGVRVTISLGAVVAQPLDELEQVINRADALMYQSKRDGRNRATIG